MGSSITHHIPDEMLLAYASGRLPHAFAMVVAAHVSHCDHCRAALEAHQVMGGAVLDHSAQAQLSVGMKDNVMALLDDVPTPPEPSYHPNGIYPSAVMQALKGLRSGGNRSAWGCVSASCPKTPWALRACFTSRRGRACPITATTGLS